MAWLSGWSKRIKLTVDNTNIDDTLSDFPVSIKISNSSGITSTDATSVFTELGSDANRKKIAVTTLDGTTQCYVEIERFDYSNSVAWLWVKVPSVSSGATTDLYLYYDSTQPNNTSYVGDTTDTPAKAVWDSNFKLVMHMAQDPNGDVVDAIKDSTGNANHGTPAGSMTSADLVDGKIGKAIDFDGSNDSVNCGNDVSLKPASTFSLELNIKTSVTSTQIPFDKLSSDSTVGDDSSIRGKSIAIVSEKARIEVMKNASATALDGTTDIVDGNWHYIAGTYDGGTLKIYVDGVEENTVGTTNYEPSTEPFTIGKRNDIGRYLGGIADEGRVSAVSRSAAWVKATYYSNWDELVSFGAEEAEAIVFVPQIIMF